MNWQKHLPKDIKALYEIHEFNHASVILKYDFPEEFKEICAALRSFSFTKADVKKQGGNESQIPKKFAKLLRSDWNKQKLVATFMVNDLPITHNTHIIDYVKGRVAVDMEWNSKDQTFDRDLFAFRSFFEYDRISIGIIITRGEELKSYFKSLGKRTVNGKHTSYAQKYGATTTHMGKLLPRLQSGRQGGCPILVFGITPKIIKTKKNGK